MLYRLLFAIVFSIILSTNTLAAHQVEIGSLFPLLNVKVLQGSLIPQKIKIVVFFASWSESCVKELLALSELYKNHKKSGLEIIAVSFDSELKPLLDCIRENKIEFTVGHDADAVSAEEYKILVIPTTYIVKSDETIKNIFVDFDKNVLNAISASIKELIK